VGEAVVSLVLADAFLEKFSGDSIREIEQNFEASTRRLRARSQKPH
jgi:chorismate synthase